MATFQVFSAPAGGVVASATQAAAGAGRRNIFTGFSASVSDIVGGVAAIRALRLRDGASGIGAILLEFDMTNLPGVPVVQSDFYIIGSANTAMTLEFDANGFANEFQAVTLIGITI